MKVEDVGESQHPPCVWYPVGWYGLSITQQGRRWKKFRVWHMLWPPDGLNKDAASRDQCLISQGLSRAGQEIVIPVITCNAVLSQPRCGRVVVPAGSNPVLELRGRDIAPC